MEIKRKGDSQQIITVRVEKDHVKQLDKIAKEQKCARGVLIRRGIFHVIRELENKS